MFASSTQAWAVLGAVLAIAPSARGAEPSHAERLFQEARALIAEKQYDEACAKLAESEALDPGIGTEFNLARCYELSGRFASARAVYARVVDETRAAGQTAREAAARARIEQLDPRLSRVRITLAAGADVAGIELQLDSTPVARDEWSAPQIVDPGRHVVRLTAAGHLPFERSVDVAQGAEVVVEIPPLPAVVQPRPTVPAPQSVPMSVAPPSGGRTRRTMALVTGGAGVAAIGTGLAFGIYSWIRADDSHADCKANDCNPRGFSARSDALQAGNLATVLTVAGGAAVAGGIVLLFTVPGRHVTGVRAAPMLAADRGGLVLRADW